MKLKVLKKLLFITAFIVLTDIYNICGFNVVSAKENNDKIEYTESYKYYMSLSDEERANVEVVPKATLLSVSDYKKGNTRNLNNSNESNSISSYYNLADYYNLKIEDQGSEGNCWAFASLNSLETYLMIHGYGEYDFSEIHLSYIESKDFYNTEGQKRNRMPNDYNGGFFEETIDYATSGYGPVLEEDFPYKERYTINDYDKLLDVTPVAYVGSFVQFPAINKEEEYRTSDEDAELIRNQVKKHIIENGSIATIITSPNYYQDLYNSETSAEFIPYYLSGAESYGEYVDFSQHRHMVSIIGWDDNYSRENFNENNRPDSDGAYIVFNSWGKNFGKDGIFYVSYEDKFVEKEMFGITEASTDKNNLESTVKISFNDRNLYKKIKESLGKKIISSNDDNMELNLTEAAVKSLNALDLSNSEIRDISGIEIFENLTSLDLSYNNINDFSPIQSLNQLQELKLRQCGITDISAIFPQDALDMYEDGKIMELLDLSDNQLINLSILKKFARIRDLRLENTGINNQKPSIIKDIKVNRLDISNNVQITDVSELQSAVDQNEELESWQKNSLLSLNLSGNNSISLDTIPAGLNELYLANMDLTNEDLSLINFHNLEILSLAYNNELTSFENINDKDTIYELDLSGDIQITIENIVHEFPRINTLIYRNSNVTSIDPFLSCKEIENDIGEKRNVGIQVLDLSYNNINLAENDFEQWIKIVDSMWIYDINLSHNKTNDMMNYVDEEHYFTMDLSYNNMYPYYNTPSYISSLEGQECTEDIYVEVGRINNFKDIAHNLVMVYNTRHSNGYGDIFEIDGADFDAKNESFIITNNPGEQASIRINRGKLRNSSITYNIKSTDNAELIGILLEKLPEKVQYIEGENLNTDGMKIVGIYSNNSFSEINDYEIEYGENLSADQGCIYIRKDGKECTINVISGDEEYIDLSENYDSIVVYKENQVTTISFTEKDLYDYFCEKLQDIINKDDERKAITVPKKSTVNVYEMIIKSDNIESLNDIKNLFPNLSEVKLIGKNYSDLSALKNSYVYSLTIVDNEKMENLDSLQDMEMLSCLTLNNTKINNLNNLNNLTNIYVDSKVIPAFDEIEENLNEMNITQRLNLSDLEYDENNIYVLPEFIQRALNNDLPTKIQDNTVRIVPTAQIHYILRDEQYTNSARIEDIELTNDNGVWKIDLTNFIEDNQIKDKYIKVLVDIRDNWDIFSKVALIINNDGAKVIDHLEIDSQEALTFEEESKIDLSNIPVYKVYTNGEKELITEYTVSEEDAIAGLESIIINYSEDNNSYELEVPIEVTEHVHDWGEWMITKYPTKSEEGEKERICTKNNSHKETQRIDKLLEDTYKVIETRNIVWIRGSNECVMLKVDADVEKFGDLIIDNNVVQARFYTVTRGSTVIDINPEFLETLEDGIHNYVVSFNDGEASGELMVKTISDDSGENDERNSDFNDDESVNEDSTSKDSDDVEKNNNGTSSNKTAKTGDKVWIYIIIVGLSVIGIVIIIICNKKKKDK